MIEEIVLMRLPQFRGFLENQKMKEIYNIADGLCDSEIEKISKYEDGDEGFFVPFFKKENEDNLVIVIVGNKYATLVSVMKGIGSLREITDCLEENEGGIEITTDFVKEVDKEGIQELFRIYFPKAYNKFMW